MSPKVHIVDNLLLVHNIDSKVTMMFDIKSKKDLGGFPVASPLPLSTVPYPPLCPSLLFYLFSSTVFSFTLCGKEVHKVLLI